MSCNLLSSKDPRENVVVTFDFSLALSGNETLSSIEAITVEVSAGVDPSPSDIIAGPPLINTDNVSLSQPVHLGVDGVNYSITAVANTTNPDKRLAVTAILPVRSQ